MSNVEIEAKVDMVGERNIKKGYGIDYDMVPVILYDGTADIRMTVFGKIAKKIKEGMKLRIKGAYVKEFRGQLQLNAREEDIEILE